MYILVYMESNVKHKRIQTVKKRYACTLRCLKMHVHNKITLYSIRTQFILRFFKYKYMANKEKPIEREKERMHGFNLCNDH